MKEEFLHYLWKHNLVGNNLFTSENEEIRVIHPGWFNSNAGPDFFNARIRIGSTEWAGNVEIHLNASDWFLHQHQDDGAYESVILHVVLNHDIDIFRNDGSCIPVLVIKGKYDPEIYMHYKKLLGNQNWIPCGKIIGGIDPVRMKNWLDRMVIERFERKERMLAEAFSNANSNVEDMFYRKIAEGFGMKVNSEAFAMLAKITPVIILNRYRGNTIDIEALLFGQAGFLNNQMSEQYPVLLQQAYRYLKNLHKLEEMDNHVWKFLRMRPVNFPTIRLSQFASLITKSDRIFEEILNTDDLDKIKAIFDLDTSAYWQDHYLFGRLSAPKDKKLGYEGMSSILVNSVIPFKFFNARRLGSGNSAEDAVNLLQQLDFENNNITRAWLNLGIKVESAYESQALMELKNCYCDAKRCLQCHLGQHLLQKRVQPITE